MKKNILIVNNTLGEGGAEKVLIDILDKFDYEKYNVKLLLLKKEGVHFNKLNKNVKLKFLYPNLKIKNELLKKIWNFIQYRSMKHLYVIIYFLYAGLKNDVEIAFLEGEPTKFVSRSINKKSKKIAWVHTDLIKCRPERVNLEDIEVYKKFDKVVCVSEIAKRSFCKIYKNECCEPNVIYNLINVDKINELSKEEIGFKFKKPTIVSIGRLTKLKRFDMIIRAHRMLLDMGIDNDLLILGIGEDEKKLKNLVKKLNVEDSVHMLGFIDNPYPYIKHGTIFAVASEFEGFSLVTAEAITLGKPIVSTSNGGVDELLKNGQYGKILIQNTYEDLANAIKEILNNPSSLEYYNKRCIERSKIFKGDEILSNIYSIIEE